MAGGTIKPIYVLHGTDSFLRDGYRHQIVESIVGDGDPQLCVSSFEATAELAEVLDELRTPSFLAPCRVVIIRDADPFVTSYREQLEKYLGSPASNAALVLIVNTWNRAWRISKLAAKIGQTFDCSAASGAKLTEWIISAAKKRKVKIATQAAELLAQMIGQDLGAMDSEIEKLSLYVGDRKQIGVEDVEAIVTAAAGPAAFALTNAITAGDTGGAMKALAGMLTRRGEEFRVLGSIGWHLRRALTAREQMDSGRTVELRMPYQQRQAFMSYLNRRGAVKFQSDFRRLISADLALKTGAKPDLALQMLLMGLCN